MKDVACISWRYGFWALTYKLYMYGYHCRSSWKGTQNVVLNLNEERKELALAVLEETRTQFYLIKLQNRGSGTPTTIIACMATFVGYNFVLEPSTISLFSYNSRDIHVTTSIIFQKLLQHSASMSYIFERVTCETFLRVCRDKKKSFVNKMRSVTRDRMEIMDEFT